MLFLQRRCGYFSLSGLVPVNRVFYTYIKNTKRFKSEKQSDNAKTVDSSEKIRELIGELKENDKDSAHTSGTLQRVKKLGKKHAPRPKRLKRGGASAPSSLPKYRSACFEQYYFFKEDDLNETTTLGKGPGGQATNRRKQTIILRHGPSGIIIRFGHFTSLWCNRRAARELLNLRLEESLLHEDSKLGQVKAMKERRGRQRRRQIKRLLIKNNTIERERSTQHDYFSFLKGLKPLPSEAVAQIPPTSRAASGEKFLISTLLDVECNNWWPILQGAFAYANTPLSYDDVATSPSTANYASLPLIFEYLFPLAVGSSKEDLLLGRDCRDADALANIQRAFRCFCEMFGLRLKELTRGDGSPGIALVTDGANWVELRARMINSVDGKPTDFARVMWPQVYYSLRALKLIQEATSVRDFFRREVKRHGSSWGKEMLEALSRRVE
ncbi:unnamed protein product [Phytomonas sp. Hart1]|nr:unnamed protein product [Phytomonas sp. Hart1]|eukprot:CCW68197.1 unnamed protein product [Phytomonas sp. isolate Hart1]